MLKLSKHVHAKIHFSSFCPAGLRFFFDIFSRKFQSFSEELSNEFQNNPNLSMLFDAAIIKACSWKISTL
jgi:hypothetical protein